MSAENDDDLKSDFSSGKYPSQGNFESLIESKQSIFIDIRSATYTSQQIDDNSNGDIVFSPTVDHDVILSDSFKKGITKCIRNFSDSFSLTIKSENGTIICKLIPKSWSIFVSKQDSPLANTDWFQLSAGGGICSSNTVPGDFSSGFGTVTNPAFKVRREGPFLLMPGQFTTGIVTGGNGSIGLPFGLQISTTSLIPVNQFGIFYPIPNNNVLYSVSFPKTGVMFYDTDTDKVWYGANGSVNTSIQRAVCSTELSNNTVCLVDLKIPVAGWEIMT